LIDTKEMFGNWLKPDDVKNRTKLIIESAEKKTLNNGPRMILKFRDVDASFILNRTNTERMIQLYGTEETKWVGKPVTLVHTMAQNPQNGNKLQKALRIL
jgi:hypothetical protein